MRNLFKITLALLLSVITIGGTLPAAADSDPNPDSKYPVSVTVSRNTAPADGVTLITFNLFIYGYQCPGQTNPQETANCSDGSTASQKTPLANRWIGVYATGSGNIFNRLNTPAGVQYVTSDANGKASFDMASTVAEAKTLQFSDHVYGVPPSWATEQDVTFTQPPALVTTSSVARAGVPLLSSATVNGKKVDTSQPVKLQQGQSLVLSGTAAPKGTVSLDINSKSSQSATVNTDDKGAWTYTIKKPAAGSYIVSGTATDPASQQPSLKVTLVSFSVNGANKPAASAPTRTTTTKPKSSHKLWWVIGAVVLVLLAGLAGWLIRRKRQGSKPPQAPTATPPPVSSPPPAGPPATTSTSPPAESSGEQPPESPEDSAL